MAIYQKNVVIQIVLSTELYNFLFQLINFSKIIEYEDLI